jgi:hypothetical protein
MMDMSAKAIGVKGDTMKQNIRGVLHARWLRLANHDKPFHAAVWSITAIMPLIAFVATLAGASPLVMASGALLSVLVTHLIAHSNRKSKGSSDA